MGCIARGPRWIRAAFPEPCPVDGLAAVVDGRRFGPRPKPADIGADLAPLGLDWPCRESDVKSAFRHRCKELHPDLGGTFEGFVDLRKAFGSLILVCQSGQGQGNA